MQGVDVASELEIRGLVARYADAVSRRDEDAFGATFATDGEWQLLGNKQTAIGRDTAKECFVEIGYRNTASADIFH